LANEYKTPPVYMPAQAGLMHHAPRERAEIDPDAKGGDRSVVKATEAPASQVVRKPEGSGEANPKNAGSDGKPDLGPKMDPANLVRAQEIARDNTEEQKAEAERRRAAVASAAEMIGVEEELVRLDGNRDGRIDQLELKHALRAKGDDTTYAALSHYRKTLGFGAEGEAKADKDGEQSDKLFAEEIAEAERAKLLEKQAGTEDIADGETKNEDDSPKAPPKSDPTVKIVV
jgi:hypothetical protein